MKEKVVPYLVQRCRFEKREKMSGIDAILSFDYMGSAEFEFGALPKSLRAIREEIDRYVYFDVTIIDGKVVTVFCRSEMKDKMKDIIDGLASNNFRLKERCDLDVWMNDEKSFFISDCWWDIENHFFFWKKNDEFEKEFQERIKGKKC